MRAVLIALLALTFLTFEADMARSDNLGFGEGFAPGKRPGDKPSPPKAPLLTPEQREWLRTHDKYGRPISEEARRSMEEYKKNPKKAIEKSVREAWERHERRQMEEFLSRPRGKSGADI